MSNKKSCFLLSVICLILFTTINKCAENKVTLNCNGTSFDLLLLDPGKINFEQEDFLKGTVIKCDDNTYQIIGKDHNAPLLILLASNQIGTNQKNFFENMRTNAQTCTKQGKPCYLKIIGPNKKEYRIKIRQEKIEQAIGSTPVLLSLTTKKKNDGPQKSIPQPNKPIKPRAPVDFKIPHQGINTNSSIHDLPKKKQQGIKQEVEQKIQEDVLQRRSQETEKALTEKLEQCKKENEEAEKGLVAYFQHEYLAKIDRSLKAWDANPAKHKLEFIDTEDLQKINNNPLAPQNVQEWTQDQYCNYLYEESLGKMASWNIQKFNEFNNARKDNNLSPLEYEDYINKMFAPIRLEEQRSEAIINKEEKGNSIAKKEEKDTSILVSAKTNRFNAMRNKTKHQFKMIKKIEKKTSLTQLSIDYYPLELLARAKKNSEALARDIVVEEAVKLFFYSLYPSSHIEKQIKELEKSNEYLEKVIELKKKSLTLNTPQEYEKEINDALYDIAMKNKKTLSDYRKKPKKKKELEEDLKKLRDKRVQK